MIKILLLSFLVTSLNQTWSKEPNTICSTLNITATPNRHYQQIQNQKNLMLEKMAHQPLFAKPADQMLSKLISAKSPAILNWLAQRGLANTSETVLIKEWRRYHLENFVLAQYPQPDLAVNQELNHFILTLLRPAFTAPIKAIFRQQFKLAQSLAQKKIDQFKLAPTTTSFLKSRISDLDLVFIETAADLKPVQDLREVFSWGVAYDPKINKIRIGLEALHYDFANNLLAVLAHEIGHSFDPCRLSALSINPNPLISVLTCLRSTASAHALPRDDSQLATLVAAHKISNELAQSLKANPTCNKTNYPPLGLQSDQILETFADWFSAEVISLQPTINKFFRSDLCQEQTLNAGSAYLSNSDRLNKIYLANPVIRQKLKLTNQDQPAIYCTALTPTPTANSSK